MQCKGETVTYSSRFVQDVWREVIYSCGNIETVFGLRLFTFATAALVVLQKAFSCVTSSTFRLIASLARARAFVWGKGLYQGKEKSKYLFWSSLDLDEKVNEAKPIHKQNNKLSSHLRNASILCVHAFYVSTSPLTSLSSQYWTSWKGKRGHSMPSRDRKNRSNSVNYVRTYTMTQSLYIDAKK